MQSTILEHINFSWWPYLDGLSQQVVIAIAVLGLAAFAQLIVWWANARVRKRLLAAVDAYTERNFAQLDAG